MSYKVNLTPFFEREFKKLYKKHRSLNDDLKGLIVELLKDPRSGEPIGIDCYKIRMSISSKGKGKSGGARVITHVRFVNEEIFLLSIYDKADHSTIMEYVILDRVKNIK